MVQKKHFGYFCQVTFKNERKIECYSVGTLVRCARHRLMRYTQQPFSNGKRYLFSPIERVFQGGSSQKRNFSCMLFAEADRLNSYEKSY